MAKTLHTTEAGVVADLVTRAVLAESAARPIMNTHPNGEPFVVLVDANGAQRIHGLAAHEPPRKKAVATFVEAQSFVGYVNAFADEHSRVFCDVAERKFFAILDYHDPETADGLGRRGEHRAAFELKLTPAIEAWLALAAKPVPQAMFAEFLEDRYQDIEEPEGAAVLELAKTLEMKNDVAFASTQRRSDGGYDLNYKETVQAKAGQSGTMEVPARILLAVQVFQGGGVIRLPVRLRFRLSGSSLFFALTFLGMEDLLRDEVENVRGMIGGAIERPVWAGSATIG